VQVAIRSAHNWAGFEAAAGDLGVDARALLERHGFVLLGTIRRDGTPRISPVEVHLVGGELMLVLIAGSWKARDVERDPRVVLQSPVADAADPGDELKLRGRLVPVDAAQAAATAVAVEAASGWRPAESWRFLALDLEAVALIAWRAGEMLLRRWDPSGGLQAPERRRLDIGASRYRP
jgi:Pyridoxamine 5'-phosphate oxidase